MQWLCCVQQEWMILEIETESADGWSTEVSSVAGLNVEDILYGDENAV